MNTQNGTLSGVTILNDQTNGLLQITSGSTTQEAQRPITELSNISADQIDPNADYFDVFDASTNRLVRVLAMRASQTNYLGDGSNDTRAGSIGTIGSSIFAVWNHIHPIIAITAPTQPVISVTGMTLVSTTLNSTPITDEESVTFEMSIQINQPVANAWSFFRVPNITGFKRPIVTITGTYRSSGNPNLSASWENAPVMGNECCNYVNSNTCYLNTSNRTQATTIYVSFSAKYVIL